MLPCLFCVPALVKVAGSVAALGTAAGGLYVGAQTLRKIHRNHDEMEAAAQWSKNSCAMNFDTEHEGGVFSGYIWEARGKDLDCTDFPQIHAVKKEAKACARKWRDHDVPSGCCKKTIGKGHWDIRITRNKKLHPIAKIPC